MKTDDDDSDEEEVFVDEHGIEWPDGEPEEDSVVTIQYS